MVHIPYKGGGPALTGLLSGEAQVLFAPYASAKGHIKDGRIRALGVTTARRPKAIPDIPTIAEAGVPGYQYGRLVFPARTGRHPRGDHRRPAERNRRRAEQAGIQQAAGWNQAIDPIGSTPEELAMYIKDELDLWAKVVKEAGIRIE